ncbi:sororin [Neoarius graeffei]|uniref:sororin n=1 Tax=Neoarius graeffei TaxID=443677 RepID=UPI00298C0F6C|nr:sororin [Neoarius graeffei]
MSSRTARAAATGLTNNNIQSRKSDGGIQPRRRSARLSANGENMPPKAEAPCVPVKRSITVRKIVPRKTQATSEPNKENVEKRVSGESTKRSKVSSPTQTETGTPKPMILSPIQASASPPPRTGQPEQDPVWSHKVRRSYSRLSIGDRSFESPKPQSASSPTRRETLFGFERLQTPEVIRKADVSRRASSSTCARSFNLSAADDSFANSPEPDLNIPGVCLVKKNTRRKKVQQIKMSELDFLAAKMNAEFEEAECFELVVE